jgi:hypothetical protein
MKIQSPTPISLIDQPLLPLVHHGLVTKTGTGTNSLQVQLQLQLRLQYLPIADLHKKKASVSEGQAIASLFLDQKQQKMNHRHHRVVLPNHHHCWNKITTGASTTTLQHRTPASRLRTRPQKKKEPIAIAIAIAIANSCLL